jgi:SET domain-containing protein
MIQPYLVILPSLDRGRGVFTDVSISKGTVIEISPVIVMGNTDRSYLDKTLMHDYIFEWNSEEKQCCVALGYVSIYNHSYQSNCEYDMDLEHELISIRTVRDIQQGEELFINYNGSWSDAKPLWFDVK